MILDKDTENINSSGKSQSENMRLLEGLLKTLRKDI